MLFTLMLRENQDFQRLYHKGACCPLYGVVIYAMPNQLPMNRLGITAGKKVGNAVRRNRAKRLIRAAYAALEPSMPIGIDLVIVARSALPPMREQDLEQMLKGRGLRHLEGVSAGSIPCGKLPRAHRRTTAKSDH